MPRIARLSSTRLGARSLVLAALLSFGVSAVQAQAVSLYGLIDLSVGQIQAPGGKSQQAVTSGQMSTSFFGVKGAEDLGGGMSAVYAIESFMRNDTGSSGRFDTDTFWARNAYVGLSSGAGTVTLGRNTTSLFVNTLIFNPFGDSFGFSPSIRHVFTSGGNVQVSGDTGWSDSVKYASPNFSGLSFTGHVALAEGSDGRNTGLSALYFSGPFGAGFAWQKADKGSGPFDRNTNTWQLGGSYGFAPFKLYGQYTHVENSSVNNTSKIIGLGGDMVVGPLGKVLLHYSRLSPDVGPNRTTISVGYDYQMSKRTDLYAVYMNDKLSGLATGTNYGVGVRHRF